jgi:hypothetical protein
MRPSCFPDGAHTGGMPHAAESAAPDRSRIIAMRLQIAVLLALSGIAGVAAAETRTGDTLLIERVQQENTAALPARGMSMAQVQARYGAPAQRLDPRGGQSRAWPTINRWSYPAFTVYFEKDKVIDAVANKADPSEIGPKPAIR